MSSKTISENSFQGKSQIILLCFSIFPYSCRQALNPLLWIITTAETEIWLSFINCMKYLCLFSGVLNVISISECNLMSLKMKLWTFSACKQYVILLSPGMPFHYFLVWLHHVSHQGNLACCLKMHCESSVTIQAWVTKFADVIVLKKDC